MNENSLNFNSIIQEYESNTPYQNIGKILSSQGMLYEASLPRAVMGCRVEFMTQTGESCFGEVVGIDGDNCKVMPYDEIVGINSETKIYLRDLTTTIKVSHGMLGRVVDYQGEPIDGKGPILDNFDIRSILGEPINPLERPPIRQPLDTGVNSINAFMTAGKGQRLAIMAGSGVGKSTLMGMIARNTNADINVIALIGERGREVLEFIESDLGEEGLKRSVVVVATSDKSPLIRAKAAYTATTIAEYFRDQGKKVLLLMDSLTRFARAQREIGLAAGEAPARRGYPPSVFSELPKLVERAGCAVTGSITAFYTVLIEGDDMSDPVGDEVRSLLDGHIVLSRDLASGNHYPAIDILDSLSRLMNKLVSPMQREAGAHIRKLLSKHKDIEFLVRVGEYQRGADPEADEALDKIDLIRAFLKQRPDEHTSYEETVVWLNNLAGIK